MAGGPEFQDYAQLAFWLGCGPLAKLLVVFSERAAHSDPLAEPTRADAEVRAVPRITREYILYFDVWRSICVALVVITHSNEAYAEWNVFAVQLWVLPYLELISGTLCAVSKRGVLDYAAKLMLYTSLGCLMNLLACLARGSPRWWEDTTMNVAFQLGFTFQLALFGLLITPLRWELSEPEKASSRARWNVGIFGTLALCLLLAIMTEALLNESERGLKEATDYVIIPVTECLLHILMLCVLAEYLPMSWKGFMGHASWLFLYSTRLWRRQPRPLGPELHLGELFFWAFTAKLVPMFGQEAIGRLMTKLWPFLLVCCGLLLRPGIFGRKDQYPWDSWYDRGRMYLGELIACMAFLTIPVANLPDKLAFPQSWRRHMVWLNWWSLLAFMSHKAFYILVDGIWPWYCMVLTVYAAAFPCFLVWRPRDVEEASGRAEERGSWTGSPRAVELVQASASFSSAS
ncbi:unnamed protein product [Symbiodinium necroappetens]|uniref:Acyltransferase 3 domain-containing protein n=1 Tax=Symbiodinium necroappetens TaxID=1628268 RepID=A0A812RBE9_9DINO|nr:unnamed protein product [Symbiodinium necroappetens]